MAIWSGGPCGRQRGQQVENVKILVRVDGVHISLSALEQHLVDAGNATEVAVDLKRRMRVKEIRVDLVAIILCLIRKGILFRFTLFSFLRRRPFMDAAWVHHQVAPQGPDSVVDRDPRPHRQMERR
jgi:hypothetical protein